MLGHASRAYIITKVLAKHSLVLKIGKSLISLSVGGADFNKPIREVSVCFNQVFRILPPLAEVKAII